MKVLYTNFHRGNGGGHDTYLSCLLSRLAPIHEVTVAAPGSSRLFRLAGNIPAVRREAVDFSPRGRAWLRELWTLWRLVALGRFDIVHVNGSADHKLVMLVRLLAWRRPRIVYTKHNDHRNHSSGNVLRAWLGTDHVIAVSEYVAAKLRGSPYARVPVTTVPHGIDTDYFSPMAPAEAAALRERYFGASAHDAIIFGSTAGTQYEKGWTVLLEALARLPAALRDRGRVILAGEPPLPCMIQKVRSLGLTGQVVFTGLLDDVRPALAVSHAAFVLSRRETLSFACREAMAMGLPVLVSNAGGLPESVNHGMDGWVVPCADGAGLESILQAILLDPAPLAEMGQAALAKSRARFSIDAFIAATMAVYSATMDLRERTAPRHSPQQRQTIGR